MTAVDTALDSALVASFAAFGESVTVGGRSATAVVTNSSLDNVFVEGGTGEAGGKSIALRKSDFPTQPAKQTLCVVRGKSLRIADVQDRLRHWRCQLTDSATKE